MLWYSLIFLIIQTTKNDQMGYKIITNKATYDNKQTEY